jgi:hypothetical protein
MAARLGNVLYWLGCIVAVGWVAVSHAEETPDDVEQFILACVWTGDRHHNTACGDFPTRTLCEREGRAAVASGELLKFECVSADGLNAILESIGRGRMWWPGVGEPTAPGPGGSDQPTFGQQMPVRTAAPDPVAQYHQQMDDPGFRWMRKVAGPSAPDRWHGLPPPLPSGGWTNAAQVYGRPSRPPSSGPLPPPQTQTVPPQPAGIPQGWTTGVARLPGGDWTNFEKNARPSSNIEDYRRTRGKPFIAQ